MQKEDAKVFVLVFVFVFFFLHVCMQRNMPYNEFIVLQ